MTDKLEMPLEQFAEAVAKENARLNEEIQLKNAQLVIRRDRITKLISGSGGIMEMKQTIADKEAEIERLTAAYEIATNTLKIAVEKIEKLEDKLAERVVWTENYGQGSEPWLDKE